MTQRAVPPDSNGREPNPQRWDRFDWAIAVLVFTDLLGWILFAWCAWGQG